MRGRWLLQLVAYFHAFQIFRRNFTRSIVIARWILLDVKIRHRTKSNNCAVNWWNGAKYVINRVPYEEGKNWNRNKSTHHQCITANVLLNFWDFCAIETYASEKQRRCFHCIHFHFYYDAFKHKYKIWIFTLFANHFRFKQIIATSCFLTPPPLISHSSIHCRIKRMHTQCVAG